MRRLPGWECPGDRLRREFSFQDFGEAFAFVVRVALLAERMNHHPEWRQVSGRVWIELTTHDAGGLTSRDFDLAEAISRLAGADGA
ncbi:MAG: 4a-hydroxytetrahydrobiopterin dehydratase [Acidobacteria bacterium]|nr:MAG: 4a-hydroxytetrahydrobiopterin dehydratase [Acidobacteriota bacterium]